MSEEQIQKKEKFMNLDRMLIVLVVLIVLYAVTKNWNDSSALTACQQECAILFQGNEWKVDSFCVCQNNTLNEANDWFVKEDIRQNGLVDFFLREDTTDTKPALLTCLKSSLSNGDKATINFSGELKKVLTKKCVKLLDDEDFRNNHDVELYCSCYLNKVKGNLTINRLFAKEFFKVDNFLPVDSLCLESSRN